MDDKTFFAAVGARLACDERRAEALVAIVFQELGDLLTAKEREDVAAQLATPLKRLWRERPDGHVPAHRPPRHEWIGRIRQRGLLPDDAEAERAVGAVFHTLQRALGSVHGTEGEAWDIFAVLPKEMKTLWLAAAQAAGPQ